MAADPNKKTPRTFQCRDVLWDAFQQMAQELECSVDYLINESMKHYARQRYGRASQTTRPQSEPAGAAGAASDQGAGSTVAPATTQAPSAGATPAGATRPHATTGSFPSGGLGAGAARGLRQGPGSTVGSGAHLPPPPPGHVTGSGAHAPPAPGSSGVHLPPPPPLGGPAGASHLPPPPPMRLGGHPLSPAATLSRAPTGMPPVPLAAAGGPATSSVPPPLPRIGTPGPEAAAPPSTGNLSRPATPGSNAYSGQLSIMFDGERLPINKDRFVIGRGKQSSDLTIKDPNVSRQHAMIEFLNGQYYMVDMGSTNGVEHNGQRVSRKAIGEGDVFRICDHEVRFTYK